MRDLPLPPGATPWDASVPQDDALQQDFTALQGTWIEGPQDARTEMTIKVEQVWKNVWNILQLLKF